MGDYRTARPEEIWKKIRDGEITEPTAGMCGGYAQANLVILPKKYAEDFKKFAERNPKPCPILEIMDGSPLVHDMGEGANIVTDIPRYFIYKNGVKVDILDADLFRIAHVDRTTVNIRELFCDLCCLLCVLRRHRAPHLNGQKCSDVQDEHRMRESR